MHFIFSLLFSFSSVFISVSSTRIPRFDRAVFFGDSLTDNGNVYRLTNQTWPTSPYYQGRFSNGPIWVDQVNIANKTDYAYAGGTTDSNLVQGYTKSNTVPVPGIRQQILSYINDSSQTTINYARTIYLIWAGGNDLLYDPTLNVTSLVNSYSNCVRDLIALGAQNLIIFNAPPIEKFPYFSQQNQIALQSALTNAINTALSTSIGTLQTTYSNISLQLYDIYTLMIKMTTNQSYPFANTIDPCWNTYSLNSTRNSCQDPSKYIFLDDFHITSTAHQLIADEINLLVSYSSSSTRTSAHLGVFSILCAFMMIFC
ncbi:unnamed protein product [Adineta ricciae]|uniref:Uncharacterized protein n=1 Tax=Adineta ricciae TaxID=249248 RepID=A0A814NKP9_ADIRI|nr:unnamed protein product [Adineta ricciae]CAF1458895.1 unnamed protein product [Adineta ricciae]